MTQITTINLNRIYTFKDFITISLRLNYIDPLEIVILLMMYSIKSPFQTKQMI